MNIRILKDILANEGFPIAPKQCPTGRSRSGIEKNWVAGRFGSNGSIDIFDQVFPGTFCTLRYYREFQVSLISLMV